MTIIFVVGLGLVLMLNLPNFVLNNFTETLDLFFVPLTRFYSKRYNPFSLPISFSVVHPRRQLAKKVELTYSESTIGNSEGTSKLCKLCGFLCQVRRVDLVDCQVSMYDRMDQIQPFWFEPMLCGEDFVL